MMCHAMRLQDVHYRKMQSGTKTFELRLYDEKRQHIHTDDLIAFENTSTGEKLLVRVVSLRVFANFEALYAALPLLKCGYTEQTVHTAHYTDMEAYYSKAEQARHGVVAIEVRRMDDCGLL